VHHDDFELLLCIYNASEKWIQRRGRDRQNNAQTVRIKHHSHGERNEIKWVEGKVECILAALILRISLQLHLGSQAAIIKLSILKEVDGKF
jgi:hypothetical protein